MKSAFSGDYSTVSRYLRTISATLISVGLLAVFITVNSWVLFSYPVGTFIPINFYGADRTTDLVAPVYSEGGHVVENYEDKSDLVESEGAAELDQNQSSEVLESSGSSSEEQAMVPSHSTDYIDPESTDIASATGSFNPMVSPGNTSSVDSECDLYQGQWYYDSVGPLYTNNSCPILTQSQNCQGNGRPDKEYENWRWKPLHCELPRFNPNKFLDLMSGKTVAFIGDSLARNQMESLMCLLWQVEVPINRGNRRMQRWYFRSKSVTIIRIWSAWLVQQTSEPFSYVPEGVAKIHLDIPDENFMQLLPTFDITILSNGHWFTKPSAYIVNNEVVGTQLWAPSEKLHQELVNINNTEAFRITTETSLTAMVTHPNYTGLTIVMSYSPDHYENGAWNTGGSCTGKVRPLSPGELVQNEYTDVMHQKQVKGFEQVASKMSNASSRLKLMDVTRVFSYRHDGHPGPYRSPDPNKATKRGPDGRPPSQDCLHWCMPGAVDILNELMHEVIRIEFEGLQNSDL